MSETTPEVTEENATDGTAEVAEPESEPAQPGTKDDSDGQGDV